MPLINETIGPANFELVRDRIGEILANEMPSQAQKNGLDYLNCTIGIERLIPVDKTECPFINVQVEKGEYDNYTKIRREGTYNYWVDCYQRASAIDDKEGDQYAQEKLQRTFGVVEHILNHWEYEVLGFQRPKISRVEVTEILMPESGQYENMPNSIMGRAIVRVVVEEVSEPYTPLNLDTFSTQVKLGDSDNGYIFFGPDSPFVPPPVIEQPKSLKILKSGQTISYANNDDGFNQFGRDIDFFTIDYNNPFGNNNRFTDIDGAQVYPDDIVLDWSTFDIDAETVLGYFFTAKDLGNWPVRDWATWMNQSPHTVNAIPGWYVANTREYTNIWKVGTQNFFDYAPFNYGIVNGNTVCWTSNTQEFNSNNAFAFWVAQQIRVLAKTGSASTLLRKDFTLTELGIN